MTGTIIYTIGHSTHPLEEFIGILHANAVDLLVDVRTVAGSRHNPQFGGEELAATLPAAGIEYRQTKELGGLRYTPVAQESINGAWRNKSFRDYADYMQTPEFNAAVDELVALAHKRTVVIMCAEALPWRCHRSLIGDALLVRGVHVVDIIGRTSSKAHLLTRFARTENTTVWYPPEDDGGAAHQP